MPRLPALKAHTIIRILKKLGFVEMPRKATSHIVFRHPIDGRRTTISYHKGQDIPPGTLRAILRDIKIYPEELRKLLKK